MPYEFRRYGRRHFGSITDRKEREHQAESRLKELFFGDSAEGWYVEVGANDPVRQSQTWHLEQKGWRGALIEPIDELCDQLRAARPHSTVVQAACGAPGQQGVADFHVARASGQSTLTPGAANVGIDFARVIQVQVRTLDEILDDLKLPRLDFISIDVEGLQLEVLRGLTLARHRPRLLFIEDHLHDLLTHRHLQSQGYRLVKRTGLNGWYVPADAPFTLTSPLEKFALWQKVILRTPLRKLRYALKRKMS